MHALRPGRGALSAGRTLRLSTPALQALPPGQRGQAPPAGSRCPWGHFPGCPHLRPGEREVLVGLSGTPAPGDP